MPWKIKIVKIVKTYKCYLKFIFGALSSKVSLTELYLVGWLIQKYVLNNTHYIASKNALFNLISLVCPESCCPCHFPASTLLGKAIINLKSGLNTPQVSIISQPLLMKFGSHLSEIWVQYQLLSHSITPHPSLL